MIGLEFLFADSKQLNDQRSRFLRYAARSTSLAGRDWPQATAFVTHMDHRTQVPG